MIRDPNMHTLKACSCKWMYIMIKIMVEYGRVSGSIKNERVPGWRRRDPRKGWGSEAWRHTTADRKRWRKIDGGEGGRVVCWLWVFLYLYNFHLLKMTFYFDDWLHWNIGCVPGTGIFMQNTENPHQSHSAIPTDKMVMALWNKERHGFHHIVEGGALNNDRVGDFEDEQPSWKLWIF